MIEPRVYVTRWASASTPGYERQSASKWRCTLDGLRGATTSAHQLPTVGTPLDNGHDLGPLEVGALEVRRGRAVATNPPGGGSAFGGRTSGGGKFSQI